MDERTPHAVLVPGPGLGHVNGCLLLAKALISAGFRVTLVCFERAYQTNKGRINVSHAAVHLEIVADGLPAATSYSGLFHVTPCMHENLLYLLQSLSCPATCLISHSFMAWTQRVADLVGIPRVDYWTSNATSYLNLLSLEGHVPSSPKSKTPKFVDCIPGFTSFPLDEMIQHLYRDVLEENPLVLRFLEASRLAKHAHCVLVQSVYDLERESVQALRNVLHIDALPIGPLFHRYENATLANSTDNVTCTWLDAHAPLSVIFVSFGSNFVHTNDEIVYALLDETVGNQAQEKARELSHVLRKAPFEGGQSHSNLLQFASNMKERCIKHV